MELRAVQAQPAPLDFSLPQAQGGTAPVSVACTPAPGGRAPVGDSQVTCTATDARQVTATCSFAVRVVAAPVLQVERFLALGDSLTFGVVSRRPLRVIPGDNYVAKLQWLLSERYFDQQPTVVNAGVPGERVDTIASRYGDALRQTNPQVLIVLAGANDLAAAGARAIPDVVRALESLTRDAQGRGIDVILSTLPPQRPGSPKGATYKEVVQLNGQILGLCSRYRALCADVYTAMGGDFSPLIGADGLHPTLAGYDRMAETYFDVIVSAYQRPALVPGPAPTAGMP
jgi:lysophospholipase L1-like esterase